MAGDIGVRERLVILQGARAVGAAAALATEQKRVVHIYGSRVVVEEVPADGERALPDVLGPAVTGDAASLPPGVRALLSPAESLGVDGLALRQSDVYTSAKAMRPHANEAWDSGAAQTPACHDITIDGLDTAEASGLAGAPTSSRLTGRIAVGIVIVEGPSAALTFSQAERVKVVAEVQNGLGWLASQSPEGVTWVYDIQVVTLTTPPGSDNLTSAEKEALWRDPAMAQLGFGAGMAGVTAYVESLRTKFASNWAYCGFFTKYPLGHFAYASIGGPRLVMDYNNDGWGPDNIDRVFAHETGHIFGAPDEYASSGCSCGGSWGYYSKPNGNCANCAPSGGVDCLMKQNSWAMCTYTPYHLGFPLTEQTYSGVWRQGSDAYYLWVNASWNSFRQKWQELAGKNLRLIDFKITRVGDAERYHGVWRQGTGGYYLWVNASWDSFVAKWQELAKQNLRLVDIEVTNYDGVLRYSGVWLPGTDGYYLWANATWDNFVAKWQELAKQNLRLIDLRIVRVGNADRFFGIWRQGTGGYYLWVNATWDNFVAKWQELAKQNLRLVDLEITQTGRSRRYSGVWLPGSDGYYLWSGASWQSFRAKWEDLATQNLRLIDIDVVPPGGAQSATPSEVITSVEEDFGGLAEERMPMVAMTAYAGRRSSVRAVKSAAAEPERDAFGGGTEGAGQREDGFGGGQLSANTASEPEADGLGGGSLAASDLAAEASAEEGFGGGQLPSDLDVGAADEGLGGGSLS